MHMMSASANMREAPCANWSFWRRPHHRDARGTAVQRGCVVLQLQLVGLSVMDTARKLKEKQQDALYHEFVEAMLPDRGKSGAAVRCSRVRFTIECEVLAKSRKFKALLDKAEAVRPCAVLC